MAVGNALLDMYREVQQEMALAGKNPEQPPKKKAPKPRAVQSARDKMVCHECGEPLVFEGCCNICKSCGWSKCM